MRSVGRQTCQRRDPGSIPLVRQHHLSVRGTSGTRICAGSVVSQIRYRKPS